MISWKTVANTLFFCAFSSSLSLVEAALPDDRVTTVGTASFYAGRFHGRRTASGERYNMHDLTTVHAHYPFGTLLRVTNLRNHKTVDLRVNDRGPLPHGRLLDVSKRAAMELGFLHAGLARVKVEVLEWGGSHPS